MTAPEPADLARRAEHMTPEDTPMRMTVVDYSWKYPPRKPARPSWWILTAMGLAFFGLVLLAGAAVGGKAIEKAAFYHVNSGEGW